MRSDRRTFLLFAAALAGGPLLSAESTPVKGLQLKYDREGSGPWYAFIRNSRSATATAYIAQATFRVDGRQRPTAFGGDSLLYLNSGLEVPASSQNSTGNSIPAKATVLTTGFLAAIYDDGYSEGDEDVVAMLLSGRHRALADLRECLPKLEKASAAGTPKEELLKLFEEMKQRDESEGAQLDEMITVPGVKHRYFMSAVPTQALSLVQAGGAEAVLSIFRDWRKRLEQSKPDVR